MDQPDQQNMGLIQEWDLGMGLDLFYQWPMPGRQIGASAYFVFATDAGLASGVSRSGPGKKPIYQL